MLFVGSQVRVRITCYFQTSDIYVSAVYLRLIVNPVQSKQLPHLCLDPTLRTKCEKAA